MECKNLMRPTTQKSGCCIPVVGEMVVNDVVVGEAAVVVNEVVLNEVVVDEVVVNEVVLNEVVLNEVVVDEVVVVMHGYFKWWTRCWCHDNDDGDGYNYGDDCGSIGKHVVKR